MTRFLYLLALAASMILATGAATAAGGTRPDDRSNHGPGAFVRDAPSEIVRPDDRAWRGVGPAPRVEIVESPSVRVDGFDWVDAGIGAAAALGFGLFLVGASALALRRQRVATFS